MVGAPGAQVDFSKPLAENVEINLHSHSNFAHTLTLQIPHNNFKKDVSDKTEKTTYKKYPKPSSANIGKLILRNIKVSEVPRLNTENWKLYVLPLTTRAQDPPVVMSNSSFNSIQLFENGVFKNSNVHETYLHIRGFRI